MHWWPIVGCEGGCKGREPGRQPRHGKEARATSDGTRETIYSRTASKRWSDCRTRPLEVCSRYLRACMNVRLAIEIYCVKKLFCRSVVIWALNVTGGKASTYIMVLGLIASNVVGIHLFVGGLTCLFKYFWLQSIIWSFSLFLFFPLLCAIEYLVNERIAFIKCHGYE